MDAAAPGPPSAGLTAPGAHPRSQVVLVVVALLLGGLIGAGCAVLLVSLRATRSASRSDRAVRLFVLSTALAGGSAAVLGGGVGAYRGLAHPPTLPVAVVEGATILGVGGLAVGALAGLVLAGGSLLHDRTAAAPRGNP